METRNEFKLGLALSGGGFRSALFHVGMLARLAELDLLRKVDVISSVSGGSIIAAYYYLKVKALLEKAPAEGQKPPGREAYIRIVAEIETDFLAAVQNNMMLRTFLDPVKNARMLATEFSNTERLAELLTEYFYQPIPQQKGTGAKQNRIPLKNIPIRPLAANLCPETRVPFLIINATSLNTGNLWQFTSVSVGEQQTEHARRDRDDPIGFLKKFRIDDDRLTIEQRKILYNITLGQAVAASCCVPGIFEPLQIRNLYKAGGKPLTVRLVDGGLVDNQGLASLFVENCTHIICSDASDILKPENHPSAQFLNVALRANDILMDRIRSKSLNELFKFDSKRHALFGQGDHATRNHIFPADSEKIVRALTRIRTDLDSFSDREADTLMYYGYQLSRRVMENNGFELARDSMPATRNWRFLAIRDRFLNNDERRKDLLHHLEVGSRQMFKVFLLKKAMPYVILLPIPVIITLLTLYLIIKISPMVFWGLLLCFALVLTYTQNQRILKLMDNVAVLRKIKHRILKTLISLRLPEPFSYIMALASWIQLTIFDRLFLRYGRVRKTSSESGSRRPQR
ncbi:MAG: patatin family protein [Desulfobacteraceae bacterium]|nr:patatin-like phospholipase family protein [Desulfobacteraceae bacterium]MBC2755508.1 patatin family protein [Desulfobacteraceae bacterium]